MAKHNIHEHSQEEISKYQQSLQRHAAKQGLIMNNDWQEVEPLLKGLLTNGKRYGIRSCPCRPASGDIKHDKDIVCPCEYAKPDIEEYGACYCWLFVSPAWQEGKVEKVQIPERRPPEKYLDF